MSAEINHKGNLKIEEYEFGAFLQAFQDAVLQGYVLDLDSNEHYPQKWGSAMEVTLVSTNFQPVEELPEDGPEAIKELLEKELGDSLNEDKVFGTEDSTGDVVSTEQKVDKVQETEEKPVAKKGRKAKVEE